MPGTNTDIVIYILIGAVIIVVLIPVMIALAGFFNSFSSEWRYLNREINRTEGAERERWKRRKRKLLLSLLPFFRY